MSPVILSALANHVWQSTVFVAVVALLALSLRRNQAQIRHWLWLTASMKFLLPFAALVVVGGQFGGWQPAASVVQPDVTFVIDAISRPFTRPEVAVISRPTTPAGVTVLPALFAIWFSGCVMHLLAWWVRWRRVAVIVREASPLQGCCQLETIRRLERSVRVRHPTAVVLSDTSLEPGIFGIWKPVLVWPRSIGQRLTDAQIEAILTHELCHVRRRDNLAVAVHMVVEAIFWFHPLVWWLEKRLVDERERACDEEVIRLGSERQVYAESILRTCEFYVESPLIVAGVTGSDLKKRVEAIMKGHSGQRLETWKRFLLATVGVLTVTGPVGIGALNAPPLPAQSQAVAVTPAFEVASIKPNKSGETGNVFRLFPNGSFAATNAPLKELIRVAYQLQTFQIAGAPSWIDSARFDIDAKPEAEAPTNAVDGVAPQMLMLRALLADRFNLRAHNESRELPIYAIALARTDGRFGPQLRSTEGGCKALVAERAGGTPPPPTGTSTRCGMRRTFGAITGRDIAMTQLANGLAPLVGRLVIDRTGLKENVDLDLSWTPEPSPTALPEPAPTDSTGPSIFTALQEQLGLKLESTKGPVEVLVIDSVAQPTPD